MFCQESLVVPFLHKETGTEIVILLKPVWWTHVNMKSEYEKWINI